LNSDILKHRRILSAKLLNQEFLRNPLVLAFKKREISTPCWKVFSQLRTDDEKWYWQLDLGLKLTIVPFKYVTRW